VPLEHAAVPLEPGEAPFGEERPDARERLRRREQVPRGDRRHHVQLELAGRDDRLDDRAGAAHLVARLEHELRQDRVDLAGHDRGAGLDGRQAQLAQPAGRPGHIRAAARPPRPWRARARPHTSAPATASSGSACASASNGLAASRRSRPVSSARSAAARSAKPYGAPTPVPTAVAPSGTSPRRSRGGGPARGPGVVPRAESDEGGLGACPKSPCSAVRSGS
jgi:hypothetical protein